MTQSLHTLAPAKLNATTLAIDSLTLGPGVAKTLFKHSGNRFASAVVIGGADRVVSFRTPFLDAYNLIGFGVLKLTNWEAHMSRFLDYIEASTATHWMASGTVGMAVINGWSVSQRGILMADVSVVPLSTTGMADPVALSNASTPPTLGAEPALQTLGPIVVNGTRLDGFKSSAVQLGHQYLAEPVDGDLYPKTAMLVGGEPQISGEHGDPSGLMTALGLNGVAVTSLDLYYRNITGQVVGATGVKISATAGRAMVGDLSVGHGELAKQGLMVDGLSSTDTPPFTVTAGAAVP
jgi:hypothetical protein